jgi:hypothetical protein
VPTTATVPANGCISDMGTAAEKQKGGAGFTRARARPGARAARRHTAALAPASAAKPAAAASSAHRGPPRGADAARSARVAAAPPHTATPVTRHERQSTSPPADGRGPGELMRSLTPPSLSPSLGPLDLGKAALGARLFFERLERGGFLREVDAGERLAPSCGAGNDLPAPPPVSLTSFFFCRNALSSSSRSLPAAFGFLRGWREGAGSARGRRPARRARLAAGAHAMTIPWLCHLRGRAW